MNARVLKLFQGHVVAHSNVLTSHSLLKPLPSQVFILQKVHKDPLGRLGRGRSNGLGRGGNNGLGRAISKDRRVNVNYLDGWL